MRECSGARWYKRRIECLQQPFDPRTLASEKQSSRRLQDQADSGQRKEVAERLKSKHKYLEAGQLLLEAAKRSKGWR